MPSAVGDQLVQRGRRDPLLGAQHVADLHQVVVHDHGQVVSRQAVGLEQHGILQLLVLGDDVAADQVVKGGAARFRYGQAHHGGSPLGLELGALLGSERAVLSIVAAGQAALLQRLADGGQLLRRLVGAIGVVAGEQSLGVLLVQFPALALHVGPVWAANVRPLVPIQPQPAQAADQIVQALGVETLLVGVLDAQNKLTVRVARQQPGKERRAQATQMEKARWAGGEASAGGLGCGGHDVSRVNF